MQSTDAPRSQRHLGSTLAATLGATLLDASLVAAGIVLALATIQTPLASTLVPGSGSTSPRSAIVLLVWGLALIAGAALLVAGMNRLAISFAAVRSRSRRHSSVARALASLPDDIVLVSDVLLHDGRPIPELLIGPFGVAIIHELGGRDVLRRVGPSWETRTRGAWIPTEHPLDLVERDADRVRRWATQSDLGFVVRVHAALISVDPSMLRSPLCAVITKAQIPDWIAALPRQRSLTVGRRDHLEARFRAGAPEEARRGW